MQYALKDIIDQGLARPVNVWSHIAAANADALQNSPFVPAAFQPFFGHAKGISTLWERATRSYPKPEFGIKETFLGEERIAISQETMWRKPFCNLEHFARDTNRIDPKVLMVAPMSGHYATLLRGTVKTMAPFSDIYITDWANARDVPKSEGKFDLDDYVRYLIDMITVLGPDTHIMAVCQPTVPVLVALCVIAERYPELMPASVTLMGGPIHPSMNHTQVTKLAKDYSIEDFRKVIDIVPPMHAGFMREVYPGYLQLTGFMSMNLDRHTNAHWKLFQHLVEGDGESEAKHREFYDEYLAVMDLTAEFYLQTMDEVFINESLPKEEKEYEGILIKPRLIRNTYMMTVEGENDDIAGAGQTQKVHEMCSGISPDMKFGLLQPKVGHYGVFNGSRFQTEIAPRINGLAHLAGRHRGYQYSELPTFHVTDPEQSASPYKKMPKPWALARHDYAQRGGEPDTTGRGTSMVIPVTDMSPVQPH